MTKHLSVVLGDEHVADLEQTAGGQHRLHYLPRSTAGTADSISLSMPAGGGTFGHRVVEPFLLGLLPDRQATKEEIAREFSVSWRNPFALLAHIGLDCAGAVQFTPPDGLPAVLRREGSLQRVSDGEIGARLRSLRKNPGSSWKAPSERWSLAGAQPKFALRRLPDGSWAEALGAEPTSHIVKPGIAELTMQALNEHVCLDAARRIGLRSAATRYLTFDGEEAIVGQRYDRRTIEGRLVRIHQEDLCQATATYPDRKYESDGGPRAAQIARLLGRHGTRTNRESNQERFVQALAFNYLIGAPDAHAKNYSVLLSGRQVVLAPLYDVASALPYDADERSGLRSTAMAIGGERRFGYVREKHWRAFAAEAGLDEAMVLEAVAGVRERILDALSDALSNELVATRTSELRERMLDKVAHLVDVSKT